MDQQRKVPEASPQVAGTTHSRIPATGLNNQHMLPSACTPGPTWRTCAILGTMAASRGGARVAEKILRCIIGSARES